MSYKNKEKKNQYSKEYYWRNKERVLNRQKEYKIANPEKVRLTKRKWREKNPDYLKLWRRNNPQWIEQYKIKNRKRKHRWERLYYKQRRKIDPWFRLTENMSSQMRCALHNRKRGKKWESLVDYTINDLIKHLEAQFDENMNWNNYGSYWHIDHKKPKSLFNYTYPEDPEFKECWALNNLQPLEAIENMRKQKYYKRSIIKTN